MHEPDRRNNPESLRLRSIAPGITASDLEASVSWYRDVVGFTLVDEWRDDDGKLRGVGLVAGAARLLLSQDDGAKGTDRKKGQGLRLYLNTAQDVDAVAESVKSRGGTLASEPADMPWGARAFDLVDPDGFALTISSA